MTDDTGDAPEMPWTPATQEQVNALRAITGKNAMRLQQLAKPPLNMGIGLDSIVLVRQNMLMDMILGPQEGEGATSERVQFELAFEQAMDEKLSELERMAARQTLTQGLGQPSSVPPEILRQIKR